MKKLAILLCLMSGISSVYGQNILDEQGRKTGPWKVEYPNGNTLYDGNFLEGKPVGLMTRYYDNGTLRAKMVFDTHQDRSYAELYYKSGKKAAEGIYLGKEKDSVWTYYSDFDETIRIREAYKAGKVNGKSISYYPGGEISEEVNWKMDSREGPWLQYYQDSTLRLRGYYQDNMLQGAYEVYYPGKILMMNGEYVDNKSEGTWSYYDEEGKLLYTLDYKSGKPADPEKYMKLMQDTLLRYDSIEAPEPVQLF